MIKYTFIYGSYLFLQDFSYGLYILHMLFHNIDPFLLTNFKLTNEYIVYNEHIPLSSDDESPHLPQCS